MSDDRYLVKAAEIAQMDGMQKVHFLNPNAQCTNKSLGDLTGLTGFCFQVDVALPATVTAAFDTLVEAGFVDHLHKSQRDGGRAIAAHCS